ncbi:MAG: glycosyltransferase family 4 protein [Nitrososphaeria archaeon]|jgi:glycosyltransferase involved in cell wall biosynthesis
MVASSVRMLRVTINSQTPPVRFNITYQQMIEKYGELDLPVDISRLDPWDYQATVGGVSRMMIQLSRFLGISPTWVSLGPGYPPSARFGDILVRYVDLGPRDLAGFTSFKEGIYGESHGLLKYEFDPRDYISYTMYNWESAKLLLDELDRTDVYLVNDFQQLLVGGIIGPSAPAVLWYHIPLVPEHLGPRMAQFLRRSMEGFDATVLSTRRDLEGLIALGAGANVKQVYPFIDPDSLRPGPESAAENVLERLGVGPDERVVLLVGRMDPIKSQDVAVRAMAGVDAKLVLVGDGSFTSSALGHGKAGEWASRLMSLARELGVDSKVKFAGYLGDDELYALYARSDAVALTSNLEGFGLTVCEAWRFGKPVVVSRGAGVSELVIDGVNGFLFGQGDPESLASALGRALSAGPDVGEAGRATMEQRCSLRSNAPKLMEILEDAYSKYSGTRP